MKWVRRSELAEEIGGSPVFLSNFLELQKQTGLSKLTLQVLWYRGLRSPSEIDSFLNPSLSHLTSPFRIQDMEKAVVRVAQALRTQEKIQVFGDYDVDGTTGTALLGWFFQDLGFQVEGKQPDRFKDGYGLNPGAVLQAAEQGVKVLITVDCGITSFEAAEVAKEKNIDLIILDHHQVSEKGLPKALAICNPQRADCGSGLKQLCGCGLAFYFCIALRSHLQAHVQEAKINLKRHLDLVVMATAADQVPLTGDNRILARHGLEVLAQTEKPGVRALMEVAGIGKRSLSPGHLGFVMGPRINASGRLGSASLALSLLRSSDPAEAVKMAHEIEKINQERSNIQNKIWDQVRSQVELEFQAGFHQYAIVVAHRDWHEGVVGIVASKVVDHFKKPAIVLSIREDFVKGSARTYGGVDILQAIRNCSLHLLSFGGHRHAAGLSLDETKFEIFRKQLDQSVGELQGHAPPEIPLYLEGDCELNDFDLKTLLEFEKLAPFGPGNHEPLFSVKAQIRNQQVLKNRHLKLNLASVGSTPITLEAIWFHGAERISLEDLGPGSWAGVPELNRYLGKVKPAFRIRDFHSDVQADVQADPRANSH